MSTDVSVPDVVSPLEPAIRPEDHMGLVFKVANEFRWVCEVRAIEFEDVEQQAFLGLLYAVKHHDPTLGCKFSTYAVPCIRGQVIHLLRLRRWKKWKRLKVRRDDEGLVDDDTPDRPPVFDIDANIDARSQLPPLLRVLLPREREVVQRHFGLGGWPEQTQEEISRDLDVSQQRIAQILESAMVRMRRRAGIAPEGLPALEEEEVAAASA